MAWARVLWPFAACLNELRGFSGWCVQLRVCGGVDRGFGNGWLPLPVGRRPVCAFGLPSCAPAGLLSRRSGQVFPGDSSLPCLRAVMARAVPELGVSDPGFGGLGGVGALPCAVPRCGALPVALWAGLRPGSSQCSGIPFPRGAPGAGHRFVRGASGMGGRLPCPCGVVTTCLPGRCGQWPCLRVFAPLS